jgi:hypothetical protein
MLLSSTAEDTSSVKIGVNPYLLDDVVVSGLDFRKEIRVGDFSDSISGSMNISLIRYNTTYDIDPFSVRMISPSTANSTGEFISHLVNNSGDMWVTSESGIEFYDFDKNAFFTLTSDSLISEVGFTSVGNGFRNLIIDRNGTIFVTHIDSGIYFIFIFINLMFLELRLKVSLVLLCLQYKWRLTKIIILFWYMRILFLESII